MNMRHLVLVVGLALGATAAVLLVSSSIGSGDVELEYKWKGCVCYVCVPRCQRCE